MLLDGKSGVVIWWVTKVHVVANTGDDVKARAERKREFKILMDDANLEFVPGAKRRPFQKHRVQDCETDYPPFASFGVGGA